MLFKTSAIAFFAGLAAAYHAPVGDPTGNPIATPGLNQIVPAGKAFEITWTPTTSNTVSLVLLRGPSTNVVPLYAIVEGISNTGSYSWTPSTALEADVTHYGLEIIDDVNGQYQYSTQFGISNDKVSSSAYPTPTATITASSYIPTPTTTVSASITVSESEVSSSSCSTSTTTLYIAPSGTGYPYSSGGAVPGNSTIILPSKSLTVPGSLLTTATGTATYTPPAFTGAASHIKAGLGMALGAAGVVFML
ncbi:hypothetical protein K491DRAFT_586210 [Lophiostoma macrostomum CBS 122681]|uniref:Yeast cell wall synthesis Kre9/Knh1-like N-terminal domain-containing protein n=1 Tax=Lophiostoma macrostomum CBS 122681 TaxID=1314788 RepID=A0A6A6TPS6_9PLEO|nr:hypothetical protein K491DRAFT_586210 [Lophiostoma macrostomum CBS 122681]